MKKTCPVCGATYDAYCATQIYCSRRCGSWAHYHNQTANMREMAFEPRSFECACCGHEVEVTDPTDRRTRFCSARCERKFWRDATRHPGASNQRISNYHSVEEYIYHERRTNAMGAA